jgi:hypothetical protein
LFVPFDIRPEHPLVDEAWLIGEHRMSGEMKYYLANLQRRPTCAP